MSPTDATAGAPGQLAPDSPEEQRRKADNVDSRGRLLAADGTPLKASLARALRREKLRAFGLVAPLLLFIIITFVAPIADMLFRSVDNAIVPTTMPRTVMTLEGYDPASGEAPGEETFRALYFDMFLATEAKEHTKLGSRLNYQTSGMSSLFRGTGREIDELGAMAAAAGGGSAGATQGGLGAMLGGGAGAGREEEESDAEREPVPLLDALEDIDPRWDEAGYWSELMLAGGGAASGRIPEAAERLAAMNDDAFEGALGDLSIGAAIADLLPRTAEAYADFAVFTRLVQGDDPREAAPWEAVHTALAIDLEDPATREAVRGYDGPGAALLRETAAAFDDLPAVDLRAGFLAVDEDWGDPNVWRTVVNYSGPYTGGYFLNAVDYEYGDEGIEPVPEFEQIYMLLFWRTLVLSVTITFTCLLLGYPIAWLLANLPMRTSNLLLILVLLPFWTSLLVRTSSWIVLLQDQGVINDLLTWYHATLVGQVLDYPVTLLLNVLAVVANVLLIPFLLIGEIVGALRGDAFALGDLWYFGFAGLGFERLSMMFNEVGTVIAMTHILLPFMILPLYSVMKTIPPSYLRAAKSLGATNSVAFWRVYFPLSIPGIGAGSILVFILAIGYYITPELVGGTSGIFISNRIAYHISSSLNWGLAAALGTILLGAVLILYWAYDKIVGIDNVKLG